MLGNPEGGVSKFFQLSQLTRPFDPWDPDRFDGDGIPTSTGRYEAVITAASGGVTPQSMTYFLPRSPTPTTTFEIVCYCAGTMIATESGEVPVEDLRAGDKVFVVTAQEALESKQIIWVGRRSVHCSHHPAPWQVWPVRVAAHAFGQGKPVQDLWLSPNHAIYIGEVLIPVKHLINGETIVQEQVNKITF